MFSKVCWESANNGMSWNGDIGTPSFSMYTRCSSVFGAATFRIVNLEAMFSVSREVPEKCRAICADREEILTLLFAIVEVVGFGRMELVGEFWLASVNRL
jgi:hypothetical protein